MDRVLVRGSGNFARTWELPLDGSLFETDGMTDASVYLTRVNLTARVPPCMSRDIVSDTSFRAVNSQDGHS